MAKKIIGMRFKKWVITNYSKSYSPESDFAVDVLIDCSFPNTNDFDNIESYLRSKGACSEAIEVFYGLKKEYLKYRAAFKSV